LSQDFTTAASSKTLMMKANRLTSNSEPISRRTLAKALGMAFLPFGPVVAADSALEILDTHQHLWDTRKQHHSRPEAPRKLEFTK